MTTAALSPPKPRRTFPRGLIALLLFAAVVRGGVLGGMSGNLSDDPDGYRALAEGLATTGTYRSEHSLYELRSVHRTAHRPPLYPCLLSTLTDTAGRLVRLRVAVCHLILGLGTVWLTKDLARRWQLGIWSYAAGVIVALDPILLHQSTLIMTETLATFLAVVALHCLTRFTQRPEPFKALLAGAAIGLAVLCRPTFLPWLGLVGAVVLIRDLRRFMGALCVAAGALVLLLPWGLRNYHEMGRFTVTTTHGGYTFWLGNNASFYAFLRSSASLPEFRPPPILVNEDYRGEDESTEFALDRAYYREAFENIRFQPGMFAYACVYRLFQLVNPLPYAISADESRLRMLARYAVAVWYVAVYALAGFGLYKLRWDFLRTPWLWGATLCFAFAGVHALYWTNLRMRAPLIPFVALVAAAGLVHLAEPFVHAKLLRQKNLRSC